MGRLTAGSVAGIGLVVRNLHSGLLTRACDGTLSGAIGRHRHGLAINGHLGCGTGIVCGRLIGSYVGIGADSILSISCGGVEVSV